MRKIISIIFCVISCLFFLMAAFYYYNVVIVESGDVVSNATKDTLFEFVDDDVIAYSEINNKAPTTIVFVGGLAAWHGTWQRTIDTLKKDTTYNYIALDLPPFGYSVIKDNSDYLRSTQAQRILKFIYSRKSKEKNVKNVILVAHSYGAGPSTEAAMNDTEHLIRKLVIIDGVLNIDEVKTAPPSPVYWDVARNFGVGLLIHSNVVVSNRLKSFVYKKDNINGDLVSLYSRPFTVYGTSQKISQWILDYARDPLNYASDKSENYKKLTIPVRIIWGEKDSLTPLGLTNVLSKNLSDNKLTVLPGVGHIPMIEDYELFDKALLRALHE